MEPEASPGQRSVVERRIGPCPRDGRAWDNQCARCGSSVSFSRCDNCDEGRIWSNDYDEAAFYRCDWCHGTGGHWVCLSLIPWCDANPRPGRETVARGSIEWFTFDKPRGEAQDGDVARSRITVADKKEFEGVSLTERPREAVAADLEQAVKFEQGAAEENRCVHFDLLREAAALLRTPREEQDQERTDDKSFARGGTTGDPQSSRTASKNSGLRTGSGS